MQSDSFNICPSVMYSVAIFTGFMEK